MGSTSESVVPAAPVVDPGALSVASAAAQVASPPAAAGVVGTPASAPSSIATAAASGPTGAPDVTVMAVVATIGTFLAAFQLFQPKFAIGAAMKRETGQIERGFFAFYVLPQYITAAAVVVVWGILFAAVLHQLMPTLVPPYPWIQKALAFLALGNLIPLLLIATVMAAVIQMNILSWIILWIGRILSMIPVGMAGAYGSEGRSPGWLQAWCICRTWDKGQPLLIAQEDVERVADILLFKLSKSTNASDNFAAKPKGASTTATANIALLGGIIEESHYKNGWSSPKWRVFYEALASINAAHAIFEPAGIMRFQSGRMFSESLRKELAAQMKTLQEPVPDGDYHAAASHIAKAWDLLRARNGSDLEKLPILSRFFGGNLYWLNRRLANFPLMHGDGMRRQVIKLMARWDVIPWAKKETFLHPFSVLQAWLLLQEQVLRTLPEQKDVTFWASGDIGITRIACQRIFEHVKKSVADEASEVASAVRALYNNSPWDLVAAADYTLWDWANKESKTAKSNSWVGSRWILSGGRVKKQP